MISSFHFRLACVGLLLVTLQACRTTPLGYQTVARINPRIAYDDSTLNNNSLPLLMPYNRLIDPAGSVIRYGDTDLENHTLDLKKIPGTSLLVVEDRYGIAVVDTEQQKILDRWKYRQEAAYAGFTSTYSGLQLVQKGTMTHIFWSAAHTGKKASIVLEVLWDGTKLKVANSLAFAPEGESPLALPNEVALSTEQGKEYLYVVLNGNNQLVKIDLQSKDIVWKVPTGVAPYGLTLVKGTAYVSNWGGTDPSASATGETAGVPYGKVFVDPTTGATNQGTVTAYALTDGKLLQEIRVGLHPNDLIADANGDFVYVANGNSDNVSVISTQDLQVKETISVQLFPGKLGFLGDTPNALAINKEGTTLYVANGLDNALAVVELGEKASRTGKGESAVAGFIPTEAYPAGIELDDNNLFVSNLEGEGARINSLETEHDHTKNLKGAYNSHRQLATLSTIPIPTAATLPALTQKVREQNMSFRTEIARLLPRRNRAPVPVPERIGEPSVFKHVLYVIKENRTYDQVFGDIRFRQRRSYSLHLWKRGNAQSAQAGAGFCVTRQLLCIGKMLGRRPSMDRCRHGDGLCGEKCPELVSQLPARAGRRPRVPHDRLFVGQCP